MHGLRFYVPLNSISVISQPWMGEHEGLCAMKCRLGSERMSPRAGFKHDIPWSTVGSTNPSSTWHFFTVWSHEQLQHVSLMLLIWTELHCWYEHTYTADINRVTLLIWTHLHCWYEQLHCWCKQSYTTDMNTLTLLIWTELHCWYEHTYTADMNRVTLLIWTELHCWYEQLHCW